MSLGIAIIIKGKDVAASINERFSSDIANLEKCNIEPALAIVRVGNKLDDISYENSTVKWMEKFGIKCSLFHFENSISKNNFLSEINAINNSNHIHGILVLRPLPEHLNCPEWNYQFLQQKMLLLLAQAWW